jgi:hypothetical protein
MRLPWQPTQYPKHPFSAAAHPARGDADRVAWARRRRAIIASLPLNEEPVPISMRCVAALGPPGFGRMLVDTMRFLRRCVCGSRNRDCRLSTLARASVARATAPTPLACGCPRFRCYPTAFHSRVRTFAHQLPSMFRRIRMRSPTHFASLPIQPYSPRQYRFCKSLLRAPFMVSIHPFPPSPPGIIPRRC